MVRGRGSEVGWEGEGRGGAWYTLWNAAAGAARSVALAPGGGGGGEREGVLVSAAVGGRRLDAGGRWFATCTFVPPPCAAVGLRAAWWAEVHVAG